jgi:translation initiation factor IF-3
MKSAPIERTEVHEGMPLIKWKEIRERVPAFLDNAFALAKELGLDLIEISPDAVPPVAKIMDYGKFQYSQNKKQKEIKVKTKAASASGEVKKHPN